MIYETQAQIDEALEYWQKVLRLQDWIVDVSIKRQSKMFTEDSQGSVHIVIDRKEAHIQLLDPEDYPNTWPQDHELTLVHELLHLHLEPLRVVANLDRASTWQVAEEQAICSISSGLVNLIRRVNEAEPYLTDQQIADSFGLSAIDRGVKDDPSL